MTYQLVLGKNFRKRFEALDEVMQKRVVLEIQDLLKNPKQSGIVQVKGTLNFRARVGDYRIIFEINESTRELTVLDVGHRSVIYR